MFLRLFDVTDRHLRYVRFEVLLEISAYVVSCPTLITTELTIVLFFWVQRAGASVSLLFPPPAFVSFFLFFLFYLPLESPLVPLRAVRLPRLVDRLSL